MKLLRSRVGYFLVCLLSCGSPLSAFALDKGEPITIGVIQSLTGVAAEDGKTTVRALTLAAEELRAQGREIKLQVEDDQSDAKTAVTAFQKLRNQGVKLIIGATWGFTTNALVPLAVQHEVLLLNTSTIPECIDIPGGKGQVVSNVMRTDEQIANFEKYLDTAHVTSAVIVSVSNSWGEAQRLFYEKALTKRGIKILDTVFPISFDANEWSNVVPRVKAKNADLLLLLLNKNDVLVFVRKAREQHLAAKIFGSYHLYDSVKMSNAPELFEGICFSYPLKRLQGEARFVENFKALYQEEPRVFADNSYDALFLISEAFRRSQEKKLSLREALQQTDYQGLVGRYQFTPEGSLSIGTSSLVCVRQGKFQIH